MGACTSDIYKTAKLEYGEAFQQFIVHEQSQLKLKEWVHAKEQQYSEKLASKKQNWHKEINQQEQSLDNNFSETKLVLQSQLPYGVASFEQMKKTSLENLLGLPSFKQKFNQARNLINSENNRRKDAFNQRKNTILSKFDGELRIDSEKLKAFHDLPEDKRKFIYEKGAKEFETQIKAKIAELQTSNTDELNLDGDLKILENVVSLKELNETVGRAKNHFKTEAEKIVGSNLDSNIQV